MNLYSQYEVGTAPSWLQDRVGRAYHFVSGLAKDGAVEAAKLAVKARFSSLAPPDALDLLLRDYDLPGRFHETVDFTRARLSGAWATWSTAGTKASIVKALEAAGFSNITVQERIDGDRWWTFRVIIRGLPWRTDLFGAQKLGTWRLGLGYRLGGAYPTSEHRDRALAIIDKFKPSHAQCLGVIIQLGGAYLGEFHLGDGTRLGGAQNIWL